MKESLRSRCQLFVENRDIMKSNFRWDNSLMHPLCASIYTGKNLKVDAKKIKYCKEIIKDKVGLFSNFRGHSGIAFSTMLSLEEDPEYKFSKTQKVYSLLKNEFFGSEYLALSAFSIVQMVEEYDYQRVVNKTKEIYSLMKSEHPFLTSSEDSTFAALFALSEMLAHDAVREIEKCYRLLKGRFGSFNACQSLSHTLALGEEDTDSKCRRTIDIFDKLRENNCRYGKNYELPVLGVLALANTDVDQMVQEVIQVDSYLKTCKGFGAFGIGRNQRIMYAAMMVAGEYTGDAKIQSMQTAALNSVSALIIAQEVAITSAIIASSAASSGSSS